jgi:hypothetical protein
MANTKKSSAPIDPRGQDVVLTYIGAPDVHGAVPSRDLTGSDLNRVAYVRELRRREAKHAAIRRSQDDDRQPSDLKLPGLATADDLEAIADELIATGTFERAEPPPAESNETVAKAAEKVEAGS